MNTAETILEQLGGNKFLAMTGARPMADGDTLRLKLPRGARDGINLVHIKLESNDTYTVTFSKYRGLSVAALRTEHMVYADNLRTVFESATGFRVSL